MQNPALQLGCRYLLALVLVLLVSVPAQAGSSPELHSVLPRGIQRGVEHTLTLKGLRLNDAQEVFFYGEGITSKSVKVIDPKKLEVVVEVAADCRLGEHVLQVRCGKGISDFRSVFVGPYPEVKEKEPNNYFGKSEKIELNHTVAGRIHREDADYFVVSLKSGQRMSVEVEAIRLGNFLDSLIAVYDSEKNEIAVCDDTELFNQDGFLSVTAPADGDYYVVIRDAAFASRDNAHYRLHIGDFDRPQTMFPPGGKSGMAINAQMIERQTSDRKSAVQRDAGEIQLPDRAQSSQVFKEGPFALPLRVSELDNLNRADDAENLTFKNATEISAPIAINGRFNGDNQRHFYKFTAQKNKKLSFDVFAKRIGSPMDPIINVFDEKNKSLIGSDDATVKPDSFLVFDPPADGTYTLRVFDYFTRSGIDMIYRVEIAPVTPLLSLSIKPNDRFLQRRLAMAIPQGGRFGTVLTAKNEHFSADVELQLEGLPEGVTATMLPLKKNAKEMPVVFEATADASIELNKVTVSAKALPKKSEPKDGVQDNASVETPGPIFDTKFTVTGLDSRGPPNNSVYHPTIVEKMAVGVIDKLPFSITVEPLKAPLVRNGSAKVKVIAHRDEGFTEKIRLQFPFRPVGVGMNHQIEMKADQTEVEYPINANNGAQLGEWPFYVIANANVSGPAWSSSKLQTVNVEEPFVVMESKRTVGARNETVKIVCQVQQLREFTGEASAVLKSLPPHVTVAGPVTFDKSTETIEFELKTTEKTPFGKHKSIFVEVSVPVGEGHSVARAGNVILQINKPLKQKPAIAMQEAVK